MTFKPVRFISEPIEVYYTERPLFSKTPGCPDGFAWRGHTFEILDVLSEWHNFARRGRMAKNMRSTHSAAASKRGSWGVGQFYFRVRVTGDEIYDIYYDRAPKDSSDRAGAWFIDKELVETTQEDGLNPTPL